MRCFVDPSAVYLYRTHVDFRKSINGLTLIVEQELGLDPFNTSLYLFSNRMRDKVKILYWDKTGFALWYKRLEKARFKWPKKCGDTFEISEQQLHWLLEGYDIEGHQAIYFSS
uniref:IS66 family insertion sequence element accessory protein TnpB n=1 Tax=Marinagarivorans algicola TaxID=1513270 RepID=UPI0006B4A48D